MKIITLDFETYYDVGFSLTNLTTEEYIRHERFQVIGVGIKIDQGETHWYTGEQVEKELNKIDWKESALLCHNTQFDGGILSFRYGIIPHLYLDTLGMARAIHGVDVGGSLAFLVEKYNLGVKGNEVIQAKGKRLEDFNDAELKQYGEYCKNDVELTSKLFSVLDKNFSNDEIKLIDITLRMYTQPVLEVDDALLQERLEEVKQLKGVRVLLSLPPRDTKGIELSPELKEELDREYAAQLDKLEVFAIGDAVEDLKIGDKVYVPTEELKRGTFVTISEEVKLMVAYHSIALVW